MTPTASATSDAAVASLRASISWELASASRTGSLREKNEDRWLALRAARRRPPLVAVADGVGGEAAGERASAAAVEAVERAWSAWHPAGRPEPAEVERRVLQACRAADAAVRALAASDPAFRRAATTLAVAVPLAGDAVIAHAGDSRIYAIGRDGCRQLTADHSWVAEQLALGALTPVEAWRHPMRNAITRYLGQEGGCEFDAARVELASDEGLLLCTDGVSNVVPEADLTANVTEPPYGSAANAARRIEGEPPAAVAVRRIMALVEDREGGDDATLVVVLPVDAPAGDPFRLRQALARTGRRRPLLVLGLSAGAGALALGAAGYAIAPRVAPDVITAFRPPPEPVAQRYLETWQAQRFDELYAHLSRAAQQSIAQEAFVKRHAAIAAEMTLTAFSGSVAAAAPLRSLPSGTLGVPFNAIFSTARYGEIRRQNVLPLVWDARAWRVAWEPAVILPELTDGGLVRAVTEPLERGTISDRSGQVLATGSTSGPNGARTYPAGSLAGPVVGYVGEVTAEELQQPEYKAYSPGDVIGQAGVEAAGEALLAGQRGGKLTVVSPSGDERAVLAAVQARAGASLKLTLDLTVQKVAEAALGNRPGSVIVLDPNDGAVRALATFPRYDPNAIISGQGVDTILADPGRALLLRPAQGLYPAGSTFKVMTMAAALESGAFQPTSEFVCTGTWTGLPGVTMRCWLPTGHGRLNLVSALTQSCDFTFYELGKRLDELDPAYFPALAARCGMGTPTGCLPGEEPGGQVPSPEWKTRALHEPWTRGDAVNLAIGQGQLLVTPLQMAAVYAGIAVPSHGTAVRLLDRMVMPGGAVDREVRAQDFAQAPAPRGPLGWQGATFDAIRAGLKGVVSAPNGTAAFVFQGSPLAGITAGKTGTAEAAPGAQPHAWFACFAPFDAPKVVVLAMIENGGEGSAVAAPIARRVLEAVLA